MNNSSTQVLLIRKYLKIKLMEDNVRFRNHNKEREHVYDLIKRAVIHGQSNSALIIGPRGCGKTTLVNSVLHQISNEIDVSSDAIIVKLNGLIHHDDKVALKSITTQMQLENAVGDKVFGTFAENLSFLLGCLASGYRGSKSTVFILDEFHAFCHSNRTQSLLYNLFDVAHNGSSPVCVLGLTNRLDVMELLEKRVKSRFSHRHIFLFPNEDDQSPVDRLKELLVELLSMPLSVAKRGGKENKRRRDSRKSFDQDIDTAGYAVSDEVLTRCKTNIQVDGNYLKDWNAHVMAVSEQEMVENALEKLCYYTTDEVSFRNILFQLVCKLSPEHPYIDSSDLCSIIDNTVAPEHRVKMLQSLSILELSLVIAMKHGMDIFDGQPMNFEMVLHRYMKFANTNSSTQTVPRPVVLKAFEHLHQLEIILPVRNTDSVASDTTTSRVQKEYKLYTLAVPVDDIREAVKGFKALPTEINHWFNNSVV